MFVEFMPICSWFDTVELVKVHRRSYFLNYFGNVTIKIDKDMKKELVWVNFRHYSFLNNDEHIFITATLEDRGIGLADECEVIDELRRIRRVFCGLD